MLLSNCELSIIIPCFNHGLFLQEALDSIVKHEILYTYEILIIDDGSTDEYTLNKLEELKKQGYHIIHQPNKGPAFARNTAIQNAKGNYILTLDADNKITGEYINKSIPILEKGDYHIVFCAPIFFGNTKKNQGYLNQNLLK